MLKNSGNLSNLSKIAKQNKTSDVVDIILFGSAVRGKSEPGDIDICIVFRERVDFKKVESIEKSFQKNKIKVHASFLIADNFFTKPHSLAKTILLEGKSLISKKGLLENYGFSNKTLFLYELKKMKPSDKVRFIYALTGRRNKKGILDSIKDKIIAPSLIMVLTKDEQKITSLMDYWGVSYKRMKLIL